MRATYRAHGGVQAYWQARWDAVPADEGTLNLMRYPGVYAQQIMPRIDGPVLEAGCGAGRVVRYFHDIGHDIVGIDFIPDVLHKIRDADSSVRLAAADILKLPFPDEAFGGVLAFGLYHNLESDLGHALEETRRTLRSGGLLCASFRADNIQNRVLDTITDRQSAEARPDSFCEGSKQFHKMNYKKRELTGEFSRSGFGVESVRYVENMPFLYKVAPFRAAGHKVFDEKKARAEGYRLSSGGRALQSMLTAISPAEFCNVYVVVAKRI